jgi:hypothetical protein
MRLNFAVSRFAATALSASLVLFSGSLAAQSARTLLFSEGSPQGASLSAQATLSPQDPVQVLRSRSTAISAEALTGLLKQASTPGINGAAAGSASVMLNLFGDTQLPFFAEKV